VTDIRKPESWQRRLPRYIFSTRNPTLIIAALNRSIQCETLVINSVVNISVLKYIKQYLVEEAN
jgi:hypothetical protein